jgi:hypothetical protein
MIVVSKRNADKLSKLKLTIIDCQATSDNVQHPHDQQQHLCNTKSPMKVNKIMSHTSLSIAPSAIHPLVNSMLVEAQKDLKAQLIDWARALAYDNLLHRSANAQMHQKLRQYHHNNDLWWSTELWKKSASNLR